MLVNRVNRSVLSGAKPFLTIFRGFNTTSIKHEKDANGGAIRSQLYEAVKSSEPKKSTIDSGLFDVLNNLESKPSTPSNFHDDLGLGVNHQIHPRDVAKHIRIRGPLAGRTIDVLPGAVSYGVGGIRALVKNNKIRYLKKVQSRFIPPAKYRKQLKRIWWRRTFLQGFQNLLAQVHEARRKGY